MKISLIGRYLLFCDYGYCLLYEIGWTSHVVWNLMDRTSIVVWNTKIVNSWLFAFCCENMGITCMISSIWRWRDSDTRGFICFCVVVVIVFIYFLQVSKHNCMCMIIHMKRILFYWAEYTYIWEDMLFQHARVITMPFFRWGFLSGSMQSSYLRQNQSARMLWRNGEPGDIFWQ